MSLVQLVPDFHLLRPWWLLALPAIAWAAWAWRRRRGAGAWERVVDPALREHLLEPAPARRRWLAGWPWFAATLAVVALAGPSWQRAPQPLWEAKAPLVVAFDLSPAMLAADLPPSRLARARAKVATLLRERRGGEIGLLVYAGEAYTVAPLTDDPANVAVFLDALAPDIMPGETGKADAAAAIDRAVASLRNAGFARGDILLVSATGMDAADSTAAARAAADGYRVSVLEAMPAQDAGATGAASVATAGRGRSARLAPDGGDLAALGLLDPGAAQGGIARGRERGATWRDDGYWLLLPLLVLAAFAFRRNGAIAVLALCLLLPWQPAGAQDLALWRRADQQAHQRMVQGAQAYRAGDYAAAERAWRSVPGADAAYDRGNALARLGRYDEAIAAYEEALRERPGMADAVANRKAVEAAKKRRPPQGQGDRQDQGSKGERNDDKDGDDAARRASRSDGERTQAAERAEREREAARRARAGEAGQPQDGGMAETQARHERRLANQARLQRVPDDPGGLLRARLQLEYERRHGSGE